LSKDVFSHQIKFLARFLIQETYRRVSLRLGVGGKFFISFTKKDMARNTGKGYRQGPVKGRDQVYNPRTDRWTKQDENGQFMSSKNDGSPYKGG
jgi:hypothetical protein